MAFEAQDAHRERKIATWNNERKVREILMLGLLAYELKRNPFGLAAPSKQRNTLMTHVPARPLKLHPAFVARYVFGVLLMLAMGLGFGSWLAIRQYQGAMNLLGQSTVWQRGVPAPSCSVEGTRTTMKLVFHAYSFRVSYRDERGNPRTGDLAVETIFSPIDDRREPVVRYLKEAPDRFALSWAIEVRNNSWLSWTLCSTVAVMSLCGISVAVFLFKELRLAILCAQKSDEILLPITKVTKEYRRGEFNISVYHFEGANGRGQIFKGKARFSEQYEPLFADSSKTKMVGLVSVHAPERPVVLRCDLLPFKRRKAQQDAAPNGAPPHR